MLYERLGVAKCNQGEYQKALEYYKKSLRLRKKSLFLNAPDLHTYQENLDDVKKKIV